MALSSVGFILSRNDCTKSPVKTIPRKAFRQKPPPLLGFEILADLTTVGVLNCPDESDVGCDHTGWDATTTKHPEMPREANILAEHFFFSTRQTAGILLPPKAVPEGRMTNKTLSSAPNHVTVVSNATRR